MPMEDFKCGLDVIIFGHKYGLFAKTCGEGGRERARGREREREGESSLVKQQWIYAYVQAVYSLTIKSEPWIFWLKWM